MTDSLSFDQLAKLFHMPLSDAAKEIGICCTALKKACRKNNITRWPHRKVKSLDRMIEGLEAKASEAPNSEEADKVMIELEYYKNQRGLIMKNTGSHRITDQALKMKPSSAIAKASSSSGSLSSSSSFYGSAAGAASSPLSSSVSSPSNVLGFGLGLTHHGLAASSSSSSSGSPSSGSGSADSSSSPEMYQPSPADSELFDNLIFASEFNQQQQQQSQLQFQQQQMAQHYQDLFQQQLALMQMPEFCTPAASQQQQTATSAGPFFPKPAGPSFPSQQQVQQQQQQVVSPQSLFYFQQPMMDGKNGAFMNPQFMYNFSPNAMPFMPNPMSAFMFPFGYPFPSFPMASNQSPVDFSAQNQLRSFPSSSAASTTLPALSTPEPSYSAESPSFFRNSDALDALFVKQEGNFDSSLPEYAQAF
eukprot:TRINITY_DN252_c0_g1_i4.p1 TRINITY_DN252_c0_g1~~TRINITY_DN252_c0_g1_i4.p1  ORF type:complete len:418 (-),score=250.33 TRINITY_DN252_c0_g1_i4:128-1381(-)